MQGSRFLKGGRAVNTPPVRLLSVRLIHAPVISLTARHLSLFSRVLLDQKSIDLQPPQTLFICAAVCRTAVADHDIRITGDLMLGGLWIEPDFSVCEVCAG